MKAVEIELEKQVVKSTFEIFEGMVLGFFIRIWNFPLNSVLELEIFRGKQWSEIYLSFDLKIIQ